MKVKILLGLVVVLIVFLVAVNVGANDAFPFQIRQIEVNEFSTLYRVDDLERKQTCYIYHSFKFGGIDCVPTDTVVQTIPYQ